MNRRAPIERWAGALFLAVLGDALRAGCAGPVGPFGFLRRWDLHWWELPILFHLNLLPIFTWAAAIWIIRSAVASDIDRPSLGLRMGIGFSMTAVPLWPVSAWFLSAIVQRNLGHLSAPLGWQEGARILLESVAWVSPGYAVQAVIFLLWFLPELRAAFRIWRNELGSDAGDD